MRLLALAAIVVAAVVLLALRDPGTGEAHHLCSATGSPQGPFDIETYEVADYRNVYARTLELAGHNQLFPDIDSFAVPGLNTGKRGQTTKADPYIPPVILKAIGTIESSWAQADFSVPYGGVGAVLASHDCGYGIMQITSGMQNLTGAPNLDQAMIGGHYAFNIARGAFILADKWNMAPELRPIVGNADPKVIENWYFALWGYNGFAFQNHPLNPAYSLQRADFSCGPSDDGFGHDRTRYPYQELVFGCIKHPPVRGGQLLWQSQDVHMPDLTDSKFADPLDPGKWSACSQSANCETMDIPTPNPQHQDQTELSVDRDGVLGSPEITVSPSNVSLSAIPSVNLGKQTITVRNAGSGVLAYRVRTSVPWFTVSRTQGVALGSDIGSRASSFVVEAATSGLGPGTYEGEVIIESLHADRETTKIPVAVTNFPNGSLIRGSGPSVYTVTSGLKRWVPNRATLEANGLSLNDVANVPNTVLDSLPDGNPLLDVLSDGHLLAGSGSAVYVMEGGQKRHITSRAAMEACGYSFSDIKRLSPPLVDAVSDGAPLNGPPCPRLQPPEGTLLQGSGWDVFVVRSGLKRHIVDGYTLEAHSFNRGNIDRVGDSLLKGVPSGSPLLSVLSTGMLVKGSGSTVWVMSGGAKRMIANNAVLDACGYDRKAAYRLSSARLNAIPDGSTLSAPPCPRLVVPNGRLVQGSGAPVYVISGGIRRHIPDRATFDALGYRSGNIDVFHDSLLSGISLGDPLLSILNDGNIVASSSGSLFVMHNGQRRPINLTVMDECGYGADAITVLPDSRLLQIPQGAVLSGPPCVAPVIPDASLVRGGGSAIYVIDGGQKRHVASRLAFTECDYQWGNVNRVASSILDLLPEGPSVTGKPCP